MYARFPYSGYQWAMSIDMSKCTGCVACVAACNAENNVAVVGAAQVSKGREMQWLRIDRYEHERAPGRGFEPVMQPLMCVHCENAPCEYVCPVNATVHSEEGLNQMVYNRCVGTRFCQNNCPYKVRRFNYLAYQNFNEPVAPMRNNPDVSVRGRGVMEKCTYCVQRIERGRIQAEVENRPIGDGELLTACQQACPTEAIVFGSVHDPKTRVSRLHESPRNYSLLGELGTRPRTQHLARIKNRNPDFEGA
jgi:molybdopterin-containing oxidoreductase family iron-sulfur binding subunit